MKQITIVDYGSGNVLSAQKSFLKVANDSNIESKVLISKNLNDIKNSTHVVLPGQGAFSTCMSEIKNTKGEMLESEGFKDYIKTYQQLPNHERLNKIIEEIIKSGRIQKDDLTIVAVDAL